MIILGIDPGYKNLGLCILSVKDGGELKLLYSENMCVGNSSSPLNFCRFLWPHLDALNERFHIDGIASETPPILMKQSRITALLWSVSSIISTWAFVNKKHFRHAAPVTLKRATCNLLEKPWSRKQMPKKSEVAKAVELVIGERCKTSHENDAVLSVLSLYTSKVPGLRSPYA